MKKPISRQIAVQELIKNSAIEDQAQLIELLKSKYNIDTNQAAISRDLRLLNISKRNRGDIMVYELPVIDVVTEILHYAVNSINHNEAMVVINTIPGTAAFVADFLDKQKGLEILGTLAGENVVFVAPKTVKDIDNLYTKLAQLIKLKK